MASLYSLSVAITLKTHDKLINEEVTSDQPDAPVYINHRGIHKAISVLRSLVIQKQKIFYTIRLRVTT